MFNPTPTIKSIFYINIFMFVLTLILPSIIYGHLAMYNSEEFKPWQLITYQFIHGGFIHIFFNMFVLLSFGPYVEDRYGAKKLWIYYLVCGVGSALLHCLMTKVSDIPLVGASGSIWGLMAIFTLLYPNEKMQIMFIPYGIKGKYIVGALLLYEIVAGFTLHDNTSHFGHIGGAISGAIIFFLYKYKLIKNR